MEHRLQAACVKWFDFQYPNLKHLLFSIPNEGARSPRNGARLKAMGRRAGMPDMVYLGATSVTFVEFKTPKGRLSKEQKEMHTKLVASGFNVVVIRSLEEFKYWITVRTYDY